MIAIRADRGAPQGGGSVDADPIRSLVDPRAHPTQSLCHVGDPIALFYPEFGRALDTGHAFRLGGDGDQGRNLVDRGRDVSSSEVDRPELITHDGDRAEWFDLARPELDDDLGTHGLEQAQEGGARRIQSETL